MSEYKDLGNSSSISNSAGFTASESNTDSGRLVIPYSKGKLARLLLFSLAFLIGGAWILLRNPETSNPVFNSPTLKIFAGSGAVLMGILGTWFFTRKLFVNKPALIIDEQGVTDYTSAFRFGLIPWSDIAGIQERAVQATVASKQRFVTILLRDPAKYVSREKSALKRRLLAVNAKSYGSPVHISANGLKIKHRELLEQMNAAFARYGQWFR